MRDEVKTHIEDSLATIREMFERAAERIEALPEDGKSKIPATKLAEEIGKEFGLSGPTMYPTMLFLFKGYPGTALKKGAHGGIVRLAPKSADADKQEAEVSDEGSTQDSE